MVVLAPIPMASVRMHVARENRTLDQPANPVAHVGAKALQPHEQIAVASVLALPGVAAEAPPRFPARGLRRRAVRDQGVGALCEMKGELTVDVLRHLLGAEDVDQPGNPGHVRSPQA